jgi:nitrite reductase/ring-hydroxylating ferredoxin subunit
VWAVSGPGSPAAGWLSRGRAHARCMLHPGGDFDQVMAIAPDGEEIILVRVGDGELRAWANRCPHVGIGLDYGDGRCLLEPGVLVCSMHGARFTAEDGHCFVGPCAGDHLCAVPIRIDEAGAIHLA